MVLLAVAVLGLAPGTASATSPIFKNASLNIHQSAQLVTGVPGGVNVTVNYSCAPPNPGRMQAQVTQQQVTTVTGTSLVVPANCDGQTHQATIFVPGAFTTGQANALAVVQNGNVSAIAEQFADISIK